MEVGNSKPETLTTMMVHGPGNVGWRETILQDIEGASSETLRVDYRNLGYSVWGGVVCLEKSSRRRKPARLKRMKVQNNHTQP